MPDDGGDAGVVHIVAPFGRDADSIAAVLDSAGLSTAVSPNLPALAEALDAQAGAVLAAQQQAAAVAGDAIGGHATAVGHARKRCNGGIDQQSGRLVVELGNHAETTGIALILRVVKPLAVAGGHLCLNVG